MCPYPCSHPYMYPYLCPCPCPCPFSIGELIVLATFELAALALALAFCVIFILTQILGPPGVFLEKYAIYCPCLPCLLATSTMSTGHVYHVYCPCLLPPSVFLQKYAIY